MSHVPGRARRRTTRLAATTLLSLALAAAGTPLISAPAHADDTLDILWTDDSATSFSGLDVYTAPSGVGLVTWVWTHRDAAGNSIDTIEMRRNSGAGWAAATFPTQVGSYTLNSCAAPALTHDPATGRLLMTARCNDRAALNESIGSYLWASADDGATWTAPVRYSDGFNESDVSPDGGGGFWGIWNNIGSRVFHVSAGYARDTEPTELTPRLVSRLDTYLVPAGPAYTPMFGFNTVGEGVWVHPGTTPGGERDVQAFTCSDYLGMAGDSTGAIVATNHGAGCTGDTEPLWVRSIGADGSLGAERQLSQDTTYIYDLSNVPGSAGSFVAAWAGYWSEGSHVHFARLTGGPNGTWSTHHALDPADHGIWDVGHVAASSNWIVGDANKSSDNTEVIWVTRSGPDTPPPAVDLPGKETYSAKKGKVAFTVSANSAGKVKAVVTVKASGRKGAKGASYTLTQAGKKKLALKLSKKLRKLARAKRARMTLKVTFTNAAGKVTKKSKVKIRR